MTIFEKVKAAVSVRDAAERYGLKVAGNNMVCCSFHNDRRPSMKLNRDYFYCFGCGATGDVIDLAGKLLGISPIGAAQKLAADFGLDVNSPIKPVEVKHPKIKAFREDELYCFRVLCDYLHILEDWKITYAPKTPDDELDNRFVEACQMLDYITFLADVLTVGALEERAATVKELMSDGKMTDLEKRVTRLREEKANEQHTRKN